MFQAFTEFCKRHGKILITVGLLCFAAMLVVVFCYVKIGSYEKFILDDKSVFVSAFDEPPVAIVPGGGIENGKPRPLLKDRLDVAAELVKQGAVRKLIVSGDNRFENYNEPQAMLNYLVNEKSIPAELVQLDNAGRSTYETCERAKKVFGLSKVLIISEATHLPRAIFLCRSFGLEAYGFKSDGESAAGLQIGQRWREVMARGKAILNVYILGEKTILGDPIPLDANKGFDEESPASAPLR